MEETKDTMRTSVSESGPLDDATHFEVHTEHIETSNTVKRGLKSRHMQFYAIGGTIGTGLFVGIGGGLATGGPLSLLLGYSITGLAIFAMVSSGCPVVASGCASWYQATGWAQKVNSTCRCDASAR
jgi:amino acid permease